MILIPAIDLKNNKCVRLEEGKEEKSTIYNENPLEQAKFFEKQGCKKIHIVDLDAAFGRPKINMDTILKIRKNTNVPIELGGGIRSEDDVSFWIKKGIDFLIMGSFAMKEKLLVSDIIKKHKDKIYIALDILKDKIMIKGWVENSNLTAKNVISFYNDSFIKGFVITDISRDGMLSGLDFKLINKYICETNKNVIVGGGLSNYEDLYNLIKIKNKNLEGVILGKSFYTGNIEIKKATKLIDKNAQN